MVVANNCAAGSRGDGGRLCRLNLVGACGREKFFCGDSSSFQLWRMMVLDESPWRWVNRVGLIEDFGELAD